MSEPRYRQLAQTFAKAIRTGRLPPGSRLPTHRAFAEEFGVALATATRVYRELERRGLVVGEAGRGTFVRDPDMPLTTGLRQDERADSVDLMFNMPGIAGDADLLRQSLRKLASSGDLEAMLRYQPHGGRWHERRILAGYHTKAIGPVRAEDLLMTSGGQHGLAIVAMALLKPGDAVAVDALTYPGFRAVAELRGLELVPIATHQGVMNPDQLERRCQSRRLRAAYLMPTVHNPLGSVMDRATRQRIVTIARRHDLILIEDGAYGFLHPAAPPALSQLAPQRTVYIGSFSKNLATGLRIGYVAGTEGFTDPLIAAIRATTWNVPALISALVTGWIEDGTLAEKERHRRQDGAMRQRLCCDVLGDAVQGHPNAGFAWLPLPAGQRAAPIITRLKQEGIAISGAEPFATTTAVPQALRLAFGGIDPDRLPGIFARIAAAVRSGVNSPR